LLLLLLLLDAVVSATSNTVGQHRSSKKNVKEREMMGISAQERDTIWIFND